MIPGLTPVDKTLCSHIIVTARRGFCTLKEADMNKPPVSEQPKFKALVRSLKIPAPYVRGYIALLGDAHLVLGGAYFETFEEIEAAVDWQGEEGMLARELIRLGWIEESEHGYDITDLV